MSFKEKFGMSPAAMIAIVLGVFMGILDNTIVNVAIPKMMSVFNSTQDQIQWVITAYMLVMGMLTPVSGYLGDRFGQRRVYMFALAMFTIGSALCGLSWSTEAIITFRIIQGIGGAMLMPVSMTMMFSMAPIERRGAIMGIWGIALMFAPALGPTLSGYLVEYFDWRIIFYLNVPIGIISFLLVILSVPKFEGKATEKLDFPGFATSLLGFFSLLYALSEAPAKGWHSLVIIGFLIAGITFLAMFVVIELTSKNPMLDLKLLRRPVYLVSIITTSLLSIAMLGVFFILPVFLQDAVGLSPLQTGLLTLPGAIVTAILMPISGFLFDRIGARPLGVVGLGLMLVTSFILTRLNIYWAFTSIMMVYMMRQAGMGLAMMPLSTAGMNDVPQNLISRATALQNTMRNVAGSIGTAFLSTTMQSGENQHFITYTNQLSPTNLQLIHATNQMPSVFGITNSQAFTQLISMLHLWAFQRGSQDAFQASMIIGILAFIAVFFIGKKKVYAKRKPPVGGNVAVAE